MGTHFSTVIQIAFKGAKSRLRIFSSGLGYFDIKGFHVGEHSPQGHFVVDWKVGLNWLHVVRINKIVAP